MGRTAFITVSVPLPSEEGEAQPITQLPRRIGELFLLLRQEGVYPDPPPVFWLSRESGTAKLNAKGEAAIDGKLSKEQEEAWDAIL